jgi:hypothetical protein
MIIGFQTLLKRSMTRKPQRIFRLYGKLTEMKKSKGINEKKVATSSPVYIVRTLYYSHALKQWYKIQGSQGFV